MKKVEVEEVRPIKDVPRGEFIRSIAPKTGRVFERVYIKGGYDRSRRMYECQAADDINQFIYLRPTRNVLVGFTY